MMTTSADTRKQIGAKMRARREYLRLTQQDMADALNINRVTYTQYETGRNEMAVSDLPRIAKLLKVHISYFFDEDDQADPDPGSEADEQEVLYYYRGIPKTMQAQAKRVLKAFMDEDEEYEEGRTFGKKAE